MSGGKNDLKNTIRSEFLDRLVAFGCDDAKIATLLKDKELMLRWLGFLDDQPEIRLVHGLFTSVEDQIARIHALGQERAWGFTEDDFVKARNDAPVWPKDRLVALVLVPYLKEDGSGRAQPMRMIRELWNVAVTNYEGSACGFDLDAMGLDRIRLLEGIEQETCLRWEVIDLGANGQRNLCDVRAYSAGSLPHAGVLAAAMLHPEWVRRMDGARVPFVRIPGYEIDVPGEKEWNDGLSIGFDGDEHVIWLCCSRSDFVSKDIYPHRVWSVPTLKK